MNDEMRKYFNFPVCLLKDVIVQKPISEVMNDIVDYAIYKHSLSLEFNEEIDKIKASSSFFGITLANIGETLENGEMLYNSISERMPKSGISKDMLFDYNQNDKTDYDIILLIAFLGIKSILGTKPYCKTNMNLLLNRMAGNSKENEPIPEYILKYRNEYHWRKLITKLETDWSLKYYSRYTRGFYVSYELTLENLIVMSEKNRDSRIEKDFKKSKAELIKQTLRKLGK